MTNKDYTAIKVVVDRSGSMEMIKSDAEGGLKAFIAGQIDVPGKATVSLTQFDTVHDDVYKSVDVRDAPNYVLEPRNGTALNDAIGRSILSFGKELADMAEKNRPANVIFVIITDGFENSSREFSASQVKKMVEHQQEKYGWNFLFLAANQDAVLTGMTYGFGANSSMTFNPNANSVAGTARIMGDYATATRSGLVYQISEDDRDAATQS